MRSAAVHRFPQSDMSYIKLLSLCLSSLDYTLWRQELSVSFTALFPAPKQCLAQRSSAKVCSVNHLYAEGEGDKFLTLKGCKMKQEQKQRSWLADRRKGQRAGKSSHLEQLNLHSLENQNSTQVKAVCPQASKRHKMSNWIGGKVVFFCNKCLMFVVLKSWRTH